MRCSRAAPPSTSSSPPPQHMSLILMTCLLQPRAVHLALEAVNRQEKKTQQKTTGMLGGFRTGLVPLSHVPRCFLPWLL